MADCSIYTNTRGLHTHNTTCNASMAPINERLVDGIRYTIHCIMCCALQFPTSVLHACCVLTLDSEAKSIGERPKAVRGRGQTNGTHRFLYSTMVWDRLWPYK